MSFDDLPIEIIDYPQPDLTQMATKINNTLPDYTNTSPPSNPFFPTTTRIIPAESIFNHATFRTVPVITLNTNPVTCIVKLPSLGGPSFGVIVLQKYSEDDTIRACGDTWTPQHVHDALRYANATVMKNADHSDKIQWKNYF